VSLVSYEISLYIPEDGILPPKVSADLTLTSVAWPGTQLYPGSPTQISGRLQIDNSTEWYRVLRKGDN
jgi:hypothetical protein